MAKKVVPALSHPLLLSLFFFAGLEVAFTLQRMIVFVLPVLIAVVFLGIIFIRYEESGFFRPYQTILPIIAAISFTSFALFLPVNIWLHLYIIASSICMYLILTHGAKHAYPTWNMVLSLIVLLVALASILGSRFHIYIPIPLAVGAAFLVTTLTMAQTLVRYQSSPPEAWLVASVLGFAAAQTIWVLQFSPLHFMVQAGIVLTVLYGASGIAAAEAEKSLTKPVVVQHTGLSIAALAALLLTARWQP